MDRILINQSTWAGLIRWSQVNRQFRLAVQSELRKHTIHILEFFFPLASHRTFWELMKKTGACIMGGVVRWVMMANDAIYSNALPEQLDIVVPQRLSYHAPLDLWTTFL